MIHSLRPLSFSDATLGISLAHPCRGDGWWWLGDRAAWHDGERLFVEPRAGQGAVAVVAIDGPVRLVATAAGVLAWNEAIQVRIGDDESIQFIDPRRRRIGELAEVTRSPAGPWSTPAVELPLGASRARDLRPFPTGRGFFWSADGFLYRHADRTEALAAAASWLGGPEGVVLIGEDEAWTHAAAPHRPLRELPCPVAEPIRFSSDGGRLMGVDPDGLAVHVHLVDNRVLGRQEAVPVGDDAWLHPNGSLVASGTEVRAGIREASWALHGTRLAGPGGRVWDLERGSPVGAGTPVQLGATLATPGGFTTVHWETGEGVHLDLAGGEVGRFRIALEEDDVVVAGAVVDGVPCVGTALGHGFAVIGTEVTSCEAPVPADVPEAADWPLPVESEAMIGGRRWAWSTDGLLICRAE